MKLLFISPLEKHLPETQKSPTPLAGLQALWGETVSFQILCRFDPEEADRLYILPQVTCPGCRVQVFRQEVVPCTFPCAPNASGAYLTRKPALMPDPLLPWNGEPLRLRADRDRLLWLMHPDVEEQLPYLAIQSGEAAKFLWNPEGGLGNFDTQRVLNKPVLFEDSCASLGVMGDILLVDPYQYILLTKGTAKQDWSIHVEFLTDQNCFRMVFRCNGAPKVSKPLIIKNSAKTRSPFVALADRK